jgi:S-adenosylmethionine decarboxylase proenzyme
MKGLHILADLHRCPGTPALASARRLRALCVKACADAGLVVLGSHFHQFAGIANDQPGGATGAVVLGESHLAIHTWPERGGATLDAYVCNVSADNSAKAEALVAALIAVFAPAEVAIERVWRGRDAP